jgi:energy-coupling factor transporter transmembrane protein EcfT
VGLLIASQTIPIANKKALEIVASMIIVIPPACLALMLMLCTIAIFMSVGLRKFKAQWLLWAIVFFTVSDVLLKKKKAFWILQPEDVYNGLLSLAVLVLTQVASPKISREELDSILQQGVKQE